MAAQKQDDQLERISTVVGYLIPKPYLVVLFKFPLFNGISIFVGYLMPNPSLKKNSAGTT